MTEVKACDPPSLAVKVDGQYLQLMAPLMSGVLSRVDLIAWESRPVGDGRQVQLVSVPGVPSMSPSMPLVTRNEAVSQQAIAWVEVRAPGYVVEQDDIHLLGPATGDHKPRRPATGWEKLARACRRYLDAYEDEFADDTSLGSVGNDLRIISAREVSKANGLHLAEVEQDANTGRFSGRCSCGEPLGTEWHRVSSVTDEWANHLAALAPDADRPGYRESWRP